MFITYYKKDNLVIFALLGEIKIVKVMQHGQKKTFQTAASYVLTDHNTRYFPVGMDVGSPRTDRQAGKLLIFVACQLLKRDKNKKSQDAKEGEQECVMLVLEVDIENGYTIRKK